MKANLSNSILLGFFACILSYVAIALGGLFLILAEEWGFPVFVKYLLSFGLSILPYYAGLLLTNLLEKDNRSLGIKAKKCYFILSGSIIASAIFFGFGELTEIYCFPLFLGIWGAFVFVLGIVSCFNKDWR